MFKWRAPTEAKPRRNTYLIAIMVMGAIVTTVGGTGIFAAFTDRATQGDNTVQSGARPSAADIKLAEGTHSGTSIQCGSFSDNLTTALWSVTNTQPDDYSYRYLCVRNEGSAAFSGSVSVIDLVNTDSTCTGDEAVVDPACGTGLGAGQLGSVLEAGFASMDCGTADMGEGIASNLGALATTPLPLGDASDPLGAGTVSCLALLVGYPLTTPESSIQAAQSDGVSWKFAFDVTAAE